MTTPLVPGSVVAGRYRIESQIGAGGMGAVYHVRHVRTDENLALKLLHPHVLKDEHAVERFRQEARAPARIASEHVARVTDADTAPELGDAPFYVMEFLHGKDLERILVERGPIPPVTVVEYLHQAARALDKAHGMGIVHRDLKPENLFLTHRDDGSPCIKLLDFGIARLGDTDAPSKMNTQAGYIFGTPAFMSPEQAVGDVEAIGPATDIWSLGLVAYKLLVGREFWGSLAMAQVFAQILTGPIPAPSSRGSSFGPAFDAWFYRCVCREVSGRFSSAGEAVAALASALGVRLDAQRRSSASLPTIAMRDSVHSAAEASVPPPPPTTKNGLVIAIAAGAVVALGTIGFAISRATATSPSGIVASPLPSGEAPASTALAPTSASIDHPAEASATSAALEPTSEPHVTRVTSAKTAAPTRDNAPSEGTLSREQRRRLDVLQRLCDQGTYTQDECKTKRAAIVRGEH